MTRAATCSSPSAKFGRSMRRSVFVPAAVTRSRRTPLLIVL